MDSLERETRERKKKMFALASLPLCMGFFVWRLQTTTAAAPPPKVPPPSVVVQAAPAVAAAAGPVLSLEKQRIVEVPLGDRDPFISGLPMEKPAGAIPAMVAMLQPKPMAVTELGGLTSLPPANPTLNSFGAPSPVTVPTATVAPTPYIPMAPPMPYVLSGIVMGNPDVAVLKHFDGSRRIVRAGDALDKKFRIASIEETSVVIVGDGDTKTLRLGGDTPPPPAKK